MPPLIDQQKCNACGICEEMCPGDIIFRDAQRGMIEVRYPEECWHCGVCKIECPQGAVDISFPFNWVI